MSTKLLHDLPQERNQSNLQKQIGCMMGIFQMFDRRRLRRKQLSREFSQQENQSRASISAASCSSSLASHAEAPPLDLRDIVKDSMTNKDGLAPIKISPRKPPKKPHVDSPRPSIPVAPPRSSLDSHTRPSTHLQDLPRWSLDSKQSSLINSNSLPKSNLESRSFSLIKELAAAEPRRPAGVVAKLMGLEELPDSPSPPPRAAGLTARVPIEHQEPNSSERTKSTKRSTGCQYRSESPIVIMKPMRSNNRSTYLSSPCSSSSSSSSLNTGSGPARIPKIRTQRAVDNARERSQPVKVPHVSPRSIPLTKENSPRGNTLNTSGSTRSPRLQQLKSEPVKLKMEKSTERRRSTVTDQSLSPRAQRPPPKKAPQPQQRNYDELLTEISLNSMRAEVNTRLASSPGRKCTELASILIQREKDVHECVKQEQPSPVSVLDFSLYREDSPSMNLSRVRRLVPEEEAVMHKANLKTVDQLLQKLWRLNLSNHNDMGDDADYDDDDDDDDDLGEDRKHGASSLIEMDNPSHQYVYQILLAAGFLDTSSDSQLLTAKIHEPGRVVDPGLFLRLEKSNRSKSKGEKLHRRLVFDAVNESLARKIESTGLVNSRLLHGAHAGEHLLKELCTEIDNHKVNQKEEVDALKPMVWEHVAQQSEAWVDFGKEASSIVLDIERTIFRDLVSEVVNGEMATALTIPPRFSRHRRRLLFN